MEGLGHEGMRLAVGCPGGHGGFEEAGSGVEFWKAVAWAGDEAEYLGGRVKEVKDLRNEEEAQRFGEVT